MADFNLDLGNGNNNSPVTEPTKTDDTTSKTNGEQTPPSNDEEKTSLNGEETADVTGKDNTTSDTTEEKQEQNDNSSTGELAVGDTIEFDGVNYTIAENGDLVDAKGKVFKKASELQDWINQQEVEDADENVDDFSVANIQKLVGVEITDEQGNPVEFTNDAAGVKSYIDNVMELRSRDIQEATINKLFNDAPILREFIDYLAVNNGNPKGFGEIRDRSKVTIQEDNVAQQEAIIRAAAAEFGNKSLNDSYIKYLKDTGGLYDEAVQQLAALVEKDRKVKKEIQKQAAANRQREQDEVVAYWKNVNNVIANRNIGGYKIPDTFIKEVNGKKVTVTPNDFYDYLSRPKYKDENGNAMTGYQRDLNAMSDEEALNAELLDAWLHFTGGTYKDLVNMAVNQKEVKTLKLKAAQNRTTKTVRIIKANKEKGNINDIVLM